MMMFLEVIFLLIESQVARSKLLGSDVHAILATIEDEVTQETAGT